MDQKNETISNPVKLNVFHAILNQLFKCALSSLKITNRRMTLLILIRID